jgi:hypothetical protein
VRPVLRVQPVVLVNRVRMERLVPKVSGAMWEKRDLKEKPDLMA